MKSLRLALLGTCLGTLPLSAETLLNWQFAQTKAIEEIKDTSGTALFRSGEGLSLADGALVIRNPEGGRQSFLAKLPEVATTHPVWLTISLKGWNIEGRPGESLSFGLAWEIPSEEFALAPAEEEESDVVTVRITRYKKERAYLDARATGIGAISMKEGQVLPLVEEEPAFIVLHYDPTTATYAVWYRKEQAAWRLVGQGATDPRHKPSYLKIAFSQLLNDTPAEGFRLGSLTLTTEAPADIPLPAKPFVTATAWGIINADTGEILGGEAIDTPAYVASVTKAMTLLVVAELAQADPSILDEVMTYTETHEAVSGSTSGLPAGTKIKVRDALYALMHPSGNDIAVLLAEHFSPRLAPPEQALPGRVPAARINFIAEMNRKAAALKLASTQYRHPAYDPGEPGSSVKDLLTLGSYAMKNPFFREVVGASYHTAVVEDASGAKREVIWRNSNHLLGKDGFNGIKTGTNKESGPCLLTSVERDGHRYIIAVLGSATYGRRYTDTANIANWAINKK